MTHPLSKEAVMRALTLIGIAALAGSTITAYAARRMFRHDMADMSAELAEGGALAWTDYGWIEYGREGQGTPVLVVHGAAGGYDQGLFVGRELFGPGYDVIAPSRFGYLRTDVPETRSHRAQGNAHAQLLDRLGVGGVVVLGISAGAPSAVEFALCHPERATALILVVPRAYAPGTEVSAEKTAANRPILEMIMQGRDLPYWLATKFAVTRRRLMRFLGVPETVYDGADPLERDRLDWIARNVLPLSKRVKGLRNDGAQMIEPWPLEQIALPTLVVSAEDDLFNTLPAARWTAEHIQGAELLILPSGGHLLCGRSEEVRGRIVDFLRRHAAARKAA
jgi:pimeloyl-ACP methyl ester carboxylesterase